MSFGGHYDEVQQQVNQLAQQHQDEQLMTSTNQSSNQPQLFKVFEYLKLRYCTYYIH